MGTAQRVQGLHHFPVDTWIILIRYSPNTMETTVRYASAYHNIAADGSALRFAAAIFSLRPPRDHVCNRQFSNLGFSPSIANLTALAIWCTTARASFQNPALACKITETHLHWHVHIPGDVERVRKRIECEEQRAIQVAMVTTQIVARASSLSVGCEEKRG